AVLRLKRCVTTSPPKTRYPVDGLPSGTGFSPARLHDLARPHNWPVPGFGCFHVIHGRLTMKHQIHYSFTQLFKLVPAKAGKLAAGGYFLRTLRVLQ
ncbi:MAG: hypothetical protein KKD44_13365, partial [Proteobacteria bacterium]|nr:hypothetical protein [Pseudomonadota bacterium]